MIPANDPTGKYIVFFDGFCGLCNGFVDWLIKVDKKDLFLFAPLQGNTARKRIPHQVNKDIDSIIVYNNEQFYVKSSAVKRILGLLGFPWNCFVVFFFLPLKMTDWFYDLVARRRYSFFGKKETCRVPGEKEKLKFLD